MEGQASPSASQIDNAHAVLDAGVDAVLFEHGHLGLLKGGRGGWPPSAGILLAGSQTQIVELGRNLVMLFVCVVRGNGDRHRLEFVDDGQLFLQFLVGAFAGENVQVVTEFL